MSATTNLGGQQDLLAGTSKDKSNLASTKTLTRKRSSIQSNMSSLATNGSGHGSLHSSSSTTASDNEDRSPNYSNSEYEHIRDTTLLFFLDRLYLISREGKEAPTLQELSCLFGTKHFTKDMRHIVGASRNGLRRFLQSYPSLFHIDGDKVHLTQLKQGTNQRDYNKEAVEYFKLKLLQFGNSLVPIKNLFGYRSQASEEVRHVSGKNIRDFKRFLIQNEDVFELLADEHVALKSTLAELESQGHSSLALEQSLQPPEADEAIASDPYLNKQFAYSVENSIKSMLLENQQQQQHQNDDSKINNNNNESNQAFKVTIRALFDRIQRDCQNELFLKMVKNEDDLKVLLRMHPKLFKRYKCDQGQECVNLLSKQEREELESIITHKQPMFYHQSHELHQQQQQQQSAIIQHQSSMSSKQTAEVEKRLENSQDKRQDKPNKLDESQTSNSNQGNSRSPPSTSRQLDPPIPQKKLEKTNSREQRSTTKSASIKQGHDQRQVESSSGSKHKLRANAPQFVPSKLSAQSSDSVSLNYIPHQDHQQHQRQQAQTSRIYEPLKQRSQSNLSRNASQDQGRSQRGATNTSRSVRPIDQRQAIKSYISKENQLNQSMNMNWIQSKSQKEHNKINEPNGLVNKTSAGLPDDCDMRARTVDIVREASNIVTRIMTTTDSVAFDCRGYNIGLDGQITLIQFGYLPQKNIDPLDTIRSFEQGKQNGSNQAEDLKANTSKIKPEVCVFDLITNPELAYCLKPLLESDKIVKIAHDVRNKSNALYVQFKIILNNVFDTQIANLVVQQQETGKPAYKCRYISMSRLCELYGDEELLKYRNILQRKTRNLYSSSGASQSSNNRNSKDVNYWRLRPLTTVMIYEATMDVYCLIGGIYQQLKASIKSEYEPLFNQLNLENILARIKPEEIKSAKRVRKIDLEVIELKRKLYSNSIGTVALSNREIRLLRYVDLTEEVRLKIKHCKKVAIKLERLDMQAAQLNSLTNATDEQQSVDESSADSGQQNERESFEARMDEFRTTGVISNLIDSSMFDELKDKMIESSSLLESLEDEDDDDNDDDADCTSGENFSSTSQHSHNGSLNHDCCRCKCHGNTNGKLLDRSASIDEKSHSIKVKDENPNMEADNVDLKHNSTNQLETNGDELQSNENQSNSNREQEEELNSSLACDMAVQCDLLS